MLWTQKFIFKSTDKPTRWNISEDMKSTFFQDEMKNLNSR